MKKILLAIITLLTVHSFSLSAQSVELKGTEEVTTHKMMVLKNGNEVIGYCTFLRYHRDNTRHSLKVWDKDLNVIIEKDIEREFGTFLSEAAFNGTHYCFLFGRTESTRARPELIFMDVHGKTTGKIMFDDLKNGPTTNDVNLYRVKQIKPLAGIGFTVAMLQQAKKGVMHLTVNCYSPTGKLVWETGQQEPEPKIVSYTEMVSYVSKDVLYCATLNTPKTGVTAKAIKEYMKNMPVPKTFTRNPQTGKKISPYSLEKGKFPGTAFNYFTEDEWIHYGIYYSALANGNPNYKEPLGVSSITYSLKGKILKQTNAPFSASEKTLLGNDSYLSPFDAVISEDGKTYLVCKTSTIDPYVYTYNSRYPKIITDGSMVIITLDKELKVLKINHTKQTRPGTYKYVCTSTNRSNNTFNSTYINFQGKEEQSTVIFPGTEIGFTSGKLEDVGIMHLSDPDNGAETDAGKCTIGTISLNANNELVNTTTELKNNPSKFMVFPAKPGYIAVLQFFKGPNKKDPDKVVFELIKNN